MLTSNELFFNYAGACSEVLAEMGSMTKERCGVLKKSMDEEKTLPWEILEESYPAAFRRIKKLAAKMGVADYRDIKVVREYWHNEHNKVIDARDGNYSRFPEVFCDYCKTHIARVVRNLPKGFVLVEYGDKQRPVLPKKYLGELKAGEKVRIHHAYAVERFFG